MDDLKTLVARISSFVVSAESNHKATDEERVYAQSALLGIMSIVMNENTQIETELFDILGPTGRKMALAAFAATFLQAISNATKT